LRAWFNGLWHCGKRAWSAGFGLGGGGGDGDVEAERLELAEVGADLAVAAGFACVPVGAEVGYLSAWQQWAVTVLKPDRISSSGWHLWRFIRDG
jgi:hypothetical protein